MWITATQFNKGRPMRIKGFYVVVGYACIDRALVHKVSLDLADLAHRL